MWLFLVLSIVSSTPYGDTPAAVDSYVQQLQGRESSYVERVVSVAKDSVGVAYQDGPLGEGPDGAYDNDPIIDLAHVDCVTFVEQCLALAAGTSYADTVVKLQQIRYAGGTIDFAHRNHFMIADWAENNRAWCVDRTAHLGLATTKLTRTISKRDFFERVKAPGLGAQIADRRVTMAYIPIDSAAAAAKAIKSPSIVVFIGKIDWLFALHCGIFIPGETGGGRLYHASSKAGAVTDADLGEYAASQSKRYLGFAVLEIIPPPESRAPSQ